MEVVQARMKAKMVAILTATEAVEGEDILEVTLLFSINISSHSFRPVDMKKLCIESYHENEFGSTH